MDQLKPVINWCKRNVFWIGCFLISAAMIGSWVFASMQLAEAQKERESEIDKQIRNLDSVTKTSAEEEVKAHPNEVTKAGMAAEIDSTINAIVAAWTQRYQEQKSIMTWPEDVLGKETADFFAKVDVPEKLSDPGVGFERYRKAYYDRIPKHMDKICRDLDVNWQYDAERIKEQQASQNIGGVGVDGVDDSLGDGRGGPGRGGSGRGGPGMGGGGLGMGMGLGLGGGQDTAAIDAINRYPVIWDEGNQQLWQQKLTDFSGYDDHPGGITYPTFMQANMLQQDLWLLEAMFKNIKKINNGSTSNDLSVIRKIDHIVFGREANAKLGQLTPVNTTIFSKVDTTAQAASGVGSMQMGMEMGMEDMDSQMGMEMGMAMSGMMMGGPGQVGTARERIAYDQRYVDTTYEPIEASKVKLVLGGTTLPEENLELIVAKRVPFRLAVEMDDRKIHEFIAVCANSEFVFEVEQVRINRHNPGEEIVFNGGAPSIEGGGGLLGGGRGGPGMGGPGMGMGGPGMGMGGPGMGLGMGGPGMGLGMGGLGGGGGTSLSSGDVESRIDHITKVEFYGIVKIYNPVRENFLKKAAGQEVIDDTADPALVEEAKKDAAAAAAAVTPPEAGNGTPPAAGANGAPANSGETDNPAPAASAELGAPAAPVDPDDKP